MTDTPAIGQEICLTGNEAPSLKLMPRIRFKLASDSKFPTAIQHSANMKGGASYLSAHHNLQGCAPTPNSPSTHFRTRQHTNQQHPIGQYPICQYPLLESTVRNSPAPNSHQIVNSLLEFGNEPLRLASHSKFPVSHSEMNFETRILFKLSPARTQHRTTSKHCIFGDSNEGIMWAQCPHAPPTAIASIELSPAAPTPHGNFACTSHSTGPSLSRWPSACPTTSRCSAETRPGWHPW